MKASKTYKREVAVCLFLWLGYLSVDGDPNVVEMLAWPIFTFAIAAFGLDSAAKQLQQSPTAAYRFRSKRSGQRPGGENEYPDGGEDK